MRRRAPTRNESISFCFPTILLLELSPNDLSAYHCPSYGQQWWNDSRGWVTHSTGHLGNDHDQDSQRDQKGQDDLPVFLHSEFFMFFTDFPICFNERSSRAKLIRLTTLLVSAELPPAYPVTPPVAVDIANDLVFQFAVPALNAA